MDRKNTKPSTTTPNRLPRAGRKGESMLVEETKSMDRKRRIEEQAGHRKFALVRARAHAEKENHAPDADEVYENQVLQHPRLDSQVYDGENIDSNASPEARRKFENERREQEKEKQYRLGLQHSPKFQPPTPGRG